MCNAYVFECVDTVSDFFVLLRACMCSVCFLSRVSYVFVAGI